MKYKVVNSEHLNSIKLSPVNPYSKPCSICAKIMTNSQNGQGFQYLNFHCCENPAYMVQ